MAERLPKHLRRDLTRLEKRRKYLQERLYDFFLGVIEAIKVGIQIRKDIMRSRPELGPSLLPYEGEPGEAEIEEFRDLQQMVSNAGGLVVDNPDQVLTVLGRIIKHLETGDKEHGGLQALEEAIPELKHLFMRQGYKV